MLRNLSGWSWYALAFAFVLPLSTALTSLLSVGVLAWAVTHPQACLQSWRDLRRQPVVIAMLVFLGVILLGIPIALIHGYSPGEILGKYARIFVIFFLLLAFFAEQERRLAAFSGFALGALLSLAVSFYAAASNTPILNASPGWDVPSFRSHTFHNVFLAIATFGLAARLISHPVERALAWAGWLLVALALFDILFLVQGRTGHVVAAALTLLLIPFLARRVRWVTLAGLILVAFIATQSHHSAVHQGVSNAISDVKNVEQGQVETNVGLRVEWARLTWPMIQNHPLLGHGTGSFAAAYLEQIAKQGTLGHATENPHSDYLFFLAEHGVLGVTSVIGLYLAMLLTALRMPRPEGIWIAGLAVAWGISSLANSFLIDHASSFVFFTLLAALVASAGASTRSPTAQPTAG